MKFWVWPFHRGGSTGEADVAVAQACRALADAKNLHGKVEQVAAVAAEIKRVNHIAAAVAKSIRGA